MRRLRSVPRNVAIEALKIIGFVEFEDVVTHTRMWAMRDGAGGVGATVRIPGFEKLSRRGQEQVMEEGQIGLDEWLDAIDQAELRFLPPQN